MISIRICFPSVIIPEPARLYHQSFHVGYRFCRSGSSELVGHLLRLRLSDREPVLKDRRNPDRCRYRYICRPVGFLTVNGCRPKRIRLPLRDRLRNGCTTRTLRWEWRLYTRYELLS